MLNRQITFALFFALASVTALRAGPADELFNTGTEAYGREDYAKAIEIYQKIVKDYASSSIIDAVRLNLGRAYLYSGKYQEAVDTLKLLTGKGTPNEIRESALYYLGQSQLSLAGTTEAGDNTRNAKLGAAVTSFTEQLTAFPKSSMREDVYYNRALANFFLEKYDEAEKDFQALITQFASSVNKADYVFWLGRTYSARALKPLGDAKKSREDAKREAAPWAKKAKDVFDRITAEDSLIVENDACFEAAELDFYLADKDDYPKVIEEYNKVRRRDDLIPEQKLKIDSIRAKYADAARTQNKDEMNSLDRLRSRAQTRLNELQERVDPAVKAAMRKAQCYIMQSQFDEARVLLRRLQPYATDEDDKKSVALQLINAYAFQQQVEKANSSLDAYMRAFPNDKDADNVSFTIGSSFLERKEYQQAYDQFDRSLRDFPKGRYAELAVLQKASAMVSLGQMDKSVKILSDFIAKNPQSTNLPQAQYTMGATQMAMQKFDDAAKSFRTVRDNPKADKLIIPAHFQLGFALFSAGKLDEALTEFRSFIQKHPQDPTAASAALYVGLALDHKKDPGTIAALNDVAVKYPNDPVAPFALSYIASIYKRENKPDVIAAYEKVYKTFPKSKEASKAKIEVAGFYNRTEKYDDAAKIYSELIAGENEKDAAYAAWAQGDMWSRGSKKFGAYTRITADEQKEVRRRLEAAEKSYVTLLKKFPSSVESGRALQGLLDLALLREEYTLLTNEQVGKYFADLTGQVDDPTTKARIQLLEAALPFEQDRRADSLAAYKKVVQATPDVPFTPGDARRFGELLLDNNEVDAAVRLFENLEKNSDPNDKLAQAEVAYGLGSASFVKKDYTKAKDYLQRLVKQYGWHAKTADAQLRLAQIARSQKDNNTAKGLLSAIISSQRSSSDLKGRAMIEFGDMLLEEGKLVPSVDKSQPNAAGYYVKADAYFGDALPEIGSEALWKAGQAYEKAAAAAHEPITRDKNNSEARKQYDDIVKKYGKTAYASKAADRLKVLPAAKP